jgi:2-iminobutanoate/2-iminopropanoate deaminase
MKKAIIILFIVLSGFALFAQQKIVLPTNPPSPPPAPIAPYRPFTEAAGFIFISGQIALEPGKTELVKGDIKTEIVQVMKNLQTTLESNGLIMSNMVKCTVYLTDIKFYDEFNEIYKTFFDQERLPAREVVQVVALPKGARVEISGIAFR